MAADTPTPEQMLPSFLQALTWASVFAGVDALSASKLWLGIGLLTFSLLSHVVGIKWPQIKPKLQPRVASILERVVGNRFFRWSIYSVIVITLLASVGFRIYRHYRPLPTAQETVSTTSTSPGYPSADAPLTLEDDSQYQLFHLSPKQKEKLDKANAPLFQYKAALADTPLYYKYKAAKDDFRTTTEKIEQQYGCLIDISKLQCLPKPPDVVTGNGVQIDISVKMVADELSKNFFWVIHNKNTKVRVPIVLFISLTNRRATPIKIDLLYLDAKSMNGWADIRMVDSFFPDYPQTMSERPLILQAKNACLSEKGEYLLPSLYDRIIQPGDKVEGWIIAEYPKGFKYGNSIGDMRISLLAGNQWVGSKTFPANPRVYSNPPFDWYLTPLNTLFTEDW